MNFRGGDCITKLKPNSLVDLANANSLMRLSSKDELQPLDKYILFRNDPQLWEDEMIKYGLTEEERLIMHEELDNQCGVSSNQESLMELFMNPKITNMTVGEVNLIRKAVAKKDPKARAEAQELVFSKGRDLGTSETLLNYCWFVQAAYQFGYAFSIPHCIAYSLVGLQEATMFVKYPSVYWYCSNLLSMSDSLENDEPINEFVGSKDKTTNYGKVAKAVYKIMQEGVDIKLPNVNESQLKFIPRESDNSILFGLKGISGINEKDCLNIIKYRPYSSVLDFHKKLVETKEEVVDEQGKITMKSLLSKGKVITLIKSGAFDTIENKPREEILMDYLKFLYPNRSTLTMQNINSIIELGLVDDEHRDYIRYYNFRKYLTNKPFTKDDNSKSIKWYRICGDLDETEYAKGFLEDYFIDDMEEDKGYRYNDKGELEIALGTTREGSFDKVYNSYMNEFKVWMNSNECLDLYNDLTFKNNTRDVLTGNRSSWEMDTICMYYSGHELANINFDKYSVVDFNDLPKDPEIVGYNYSRNVKYPKYKLSRIIGTVLDRNKNKHSITLLTPTGVVTVKMYSGQFTHYDRNLSYIDEISGSKVTVEEGWFKKGTLLLITGYRQENIFRSKIYKDDVYSHTIQKINGINNESSLILQQERPKI